MSFAQGQPTVPTILNTSNCLVFGNTASGNALSVQQLGAGNVFSFSNASGGSNVFIMNNLGRVGVGTTSPSYPFQLSAPGTATSVIATFLQPNLTTGGAVTVLGLGTTYSTATCGAIAFMNYGTNTTNVFQLSLAGYASSAVHITSSGVGIGTTNPLNTLDVYGSQTTRNPTVYNTSTLGWYNIGLWDASVGTGGNNGQRLRLELIGGEGYDTNSAAQWGGVTTIYATIMNNSVGTVANCGGTWKHDGSIACVSAVKFVQNGANRNQYYVYANFRTYTQHGLKIDTTQGSAFTPSFTSTTDPGADSATVRAAVFSMIAGYGTGGSVGIGTTNPQSNLHVYATVGGAGLTVGPTPPYTAAAGMFGLAILNDGLTSGQYSAIQIGKSGTNSSFMSYNYTGLATNDYLSLTQYGSASGSALVVRGNNNVGIGLTNPGYGLEVVGTFRTSTTMTFSGGAGGGVRYVQVDNNGTVSYLASDARLKTNIMPVSYGLASVLQLNPVTFNWKDSNVGGTYTDIGFIAQEVEPIIPEVVRIDANGTYSLNLPNINAVLVKAIQELAAKNTDLESKLQTAQNDIDLLESRLAAIEALIGTNTSADTGAGGSGTRADALLAQV